MTYPDGPDPWQRNEQQPPRQYREGGIEHVFHIARNPGISRSPAGSTSLKSSMGWHGSKTRAPGDQLIKTKLLSATYLGWDMPGFLHLKLLLSLSLSLSLGAAGRLPGDCRSTPLLKVFGVCRNLPTHTV